MNKETVKAMNKKPTKIDDLKHWWRQNGYKVMRVILFPIWFYIKAKEKIDKKLNSKTVWNEIRANEILSYYIPRCAKWDEEKKAFYFFDNGYGWDSRYSKKYVKLRDRRFWKLYAHPWGGRMRDYLIQNFELEGFTKQVYECYDYTDTDLAFILKED